MADFAPPSPFVPLEGGCACGKVRYRLEVLPFAVHACHCRDCQKESGSAYQLNYGVETDKITFISGKADIVDIKKPGSNEGAAGLSMYIECCSVEKHSLTISPGSAAQPATSASTTKTPS